MVDEEDVYGGDVGGEGKGWIEKEVEDLVVERERNNRKIIV